MAGIKLGMLTVLVGVIVGGLIVSYAWGLSWVEGMAVIAILLGGLVASVLIAVFLPIGNMMVKAVALCVVLALVVLWGLSYIGVM
jgi:hypothetical protein